ncbi:MAG: rhamnulokinase [Planctomycetia bacterium]|nr:rhamnulokinase [Planctomycetia bacterium]
MSDQIFLAVDIGASSGRLLAGLFNGRRLQLEEVHRFENGAVDFGGSLQWNVLGLWQQILSGMRAARSKYGDRIRSIGVDTWGVDFALLGRDDVMLGNPVSYRDRRTEGQMDRAVAQLGREEIFSHTGLQFMPINTLYQLMALQAQNSPLLEAAKSFLMMPDLFHFLLTGVKANEITNATTTQFFNPVLRNWASELLDKLGLPTHILGELAEPGTTLGSLRSSVARETGLPPIDVVLPGTHDTASAVLAVPARSAPGARPDWCYISSGTWSLIGIETPAPVMSELCRKLTFTNEGGVGHTVRVLKNITGLWIVQECRRIWSQSGVDFAGGEYSWDALNRMSAAAEPLVSFIDPDDATFQAPQNMPEAIRAFCKRTGQAVPAGEGEIVRTAIDSLALKYRYVLGKLEELAGGRLETIHVVGGGTQNRQLCQATADACGRRVVAGPIEATAIGNVMMQAIAAGAVGNIAQAREVVGESFSVEEYSPCDAGRWDEAYGKFVRLLPRD